MQASNYACALKPMGAYGEMAVRSSLGMKNTFPFMFTIRRMASCETHTPLLADGATRISLFTGFQARGLAEADTVVDLLNVLAEFETTVAGNRRGTQAQPWLRSPLVWYRARVLVPRRVRRLLALCRMSDRMSALTPGVTSATLRENHCLSVPYSWGTAPNCSIKPQIIDCHLLERTCSSGLFHRCIG